MVVGKDQAVMFEIEHFPFYLFKKEILIVIFWALSSLRLGEGQNKPPWK